MHPCNTYLIVITIAVMSIAGCTGDEYQITDEYITLSCIEELRPEKVAIYVDTTPSVQGYVYDDRYRELLLNGLRNASPARASVEYYSVRTRGGQNFVDAMSPVSSSSGSAYSWGDTDLTLAVEHADTTSLSIIVTDFFQTDSDVAGFSDAIARRFLNAGRSVGLVRVNFHFSGTIYDVGLDQPLSIDHTGSRPLYLIMLGGNRAIEEYISRLYFDQDEDPQILIIGPCLVAENAFTTEGSWATQDLVVHDTRGHQGLHIGIPRRVDRGSIAIDLEPEVGTYTLGIDSADLHAQISDVASCESANPNPDVNPLRGLNASFDASRTGSSIRIDISDPQALHPCTRIELLTTVRTFTLPQWVADADLRLTDVESWRVNASDFDAMLTQGLRPFLQRIADTITDVYPPVIAKGVIYIERK